MIVWIASIALVILLFVLYWVVKMENKNNE